MKKSNFSPIKLGNYACNFAQAYVFVSTTGIAPCVLEQHGGVTGVLLIDKERQNEKEIKDGRKLFH